MTTVDFQGVDFCTAMGEVYGLRTWIVDSYGRLKALHVRAAPAWRPGVNVATCHKKDDDAGWVALGSGIQYAFTYAAGGIVDAPKAAPVVDREPETHETPSDKCRCGFYAYTDPKHEEAGAYRGIGYITGVVRGSGRTLIGTRGFRSEKAEIVALLDPTRGGKKTTPWRTEQLAKLGRVYPDVPMMASRAALLDFAPVEVTLPDPGTDEFWALP